jgi:hypothetical protein
MPAIQSAYPAEQATAYEGSIANTEPNNLISRTVEGAAIPFGRVARQGAADYGVIEATTAADIVRGIVVRDQSTPGTSVNASPVGETALVMERGVVWVRAGAACTRGTAVFMVVGTGQAGRFTSTSASNLPIPRAIFETNAAAAGELVAVRLS